jgi:hypothetical protein
VPDGGYFVLVNMKKVRLPDTYVYPEHISTRPRDFKLAWFLINELGVAAIPPSGKFFTQCFGGKWPLISLQSSLRMRMRELWRIGYGSQSVGLMID